MAVTTSSRMLALLSLLQAHAFWTGPSLAERLEVTPRTLRRDIDRLRELGYRVTATRGVAGGYQLEAGTGVPPLLLTEDEAVAVAVGLHSAATSGLLHAEGLGVSALAKLEQVLPARLRRRVSATSAHTVRARPGPGIEESVPAETVGRLALACRDSERMRFDYRARDGADSRRNVEPHTLVTLDRRWYLVAWDVERADWRTFRVDRIGELRSTAVRFVSRTVPGADAAEFVRRSVWHSARRYRAAIRVHLPIAQFAVSFGSWGRGASADGDGWSRWPIEASSLAELVSMPTWLPPGIDFVVEADGAELAAFRAHAERLSAAVSGVA